MAVKEDIVEISKDGFQIVSGEMFRHAFRLNAPTATLWPNSISFSKAALQTLNNCERIRIEINLKKRCILVVPVTEKDKDNIRWIKTGKDISIRKIECLAFTSQLYEAWGWKSHLAYRVSGRLVSVDKKVMLLFDFSNPESWRFKDKAKDEKNE